MVWHDPDNFIAEPPIEATWEEFSSFHRERFRSLTFSEFDTIEKTSLFYLEQNVPPYGGIERDFVPLNFLSSLFLHTHKGNEGTRILISIAMIYWKKIHFSLYYTVQSSNNLLCKILQMIEVFVK